MDSNNVVSAQIVKSKKTKLKNIASLILITVLSLSLTLSAQPNSDESTIGLKPASPIPWPWEFWGIYQDSEGVKAPVLANNVKDPSPTMSPACTTPEINMILLIDRSSLQFRYFDPDQYLELREGVKDFLARLSAMAQSRGGKAHVIIGAYGTYNVWQNLPQTRIDSHTWNDEAKAQINIADLNILQQQQAIIDNIYFNPISNDPGDIDSPLGYKGGEEARRNINDRHTKEMNIQDALVQSSREISRWVGGRSSAGPDEDIDLVMVMTGGKPNVNNGVGNFPGRNAVFRDQNALREFNREIIGNWRDANDEDTWRTRDTVSKIRTGEALGQYNDPRDFGRHLTDSEPGDPLFTGARPPARVFGVTLLPRGNLISEVAPAMTTMFGWEYANNSHNPPTLFGTHRNWDKVMGDVERNQLVGDLVLPLLDLPCPVNLGVVEPALEIEVTGGGSVIAGQSVTLTVRLTNNSPAPVRNVEIVLGDPIGPGSNTRIVPNTIPVQIESILTDTQCQDAAWTFIVNLIGANPEDIPCHYTRNQTYGMRYEGGYATNSLNNLIIPVGATVERDISFTFPLNATTSFNGQINAYANARLFYDEYSQFAWNQPRSGDLDQNRGFIWIDTGTVLSLDDQLFPT